MKLRRFDTSNIKVRGGSGGGRFPGGGGGKLGCGTIVIALIGAVVFGVDPAQMLGMADSVQQSAPRQASNDMSEEDICTQGPYATEACNALQSLNETWEPIFRRENIGFEQPTLTLFSGGTQSGCGAASSAMGPFYCPADQGIYIDTSFYDQMERQMGAGGDFARYYVMAHEYGHHIQTLTGVSSQVRSVQQQNPRAANRLQVAMELQADCYAGVWAGLNRNLIERGDFEEGMRAASAIGDDTIMERAGRRANPESFTHGSSAQRMNWLRRGIETGDSNQCDTFAEFRR